MESYTLKNLIKINNSTNLYGDDNLYNIFRQTYIDIYSYMNMTYVKDGEEMRLDKISLRLYGSRNYIEELMQLNNIINIWNIDLGDIIYYTPSTSLEYFKSLEKEIDSVIDNVAKPNKNTRIDPERIVNVPPTIKPKSMQSVIIDTKNKKITISGKLT